MAIFKNGDLDSNMVKVDMTLRLIVNWNYTFTFDVCIADIGAFGQF